MEWSKLKNVIILLLLALNLFFLVLVGGQTYELSRAQTRMKEETLTLLEKQGILVEEDMVPWDETYESIALSRERDREEERRLAEEILGGVTSQQLGSTTQYHGSLGTVQFYQSGQFSIQLDSGKVPLEGEAERHAVDYLKGVGIPAEVKAVSREEGTVTVELWQLWQGKPMFTCQIKMIYQDNALTKVQGLRLSGEEPMAGTAVGGLATETLLIRLMGALRDADAKGSWDIQRILPGYLHRTTGVSAQRVTLIPVWWMETVQGDCLVLNCLDGTLEELQELGWR
ncbi:MAG: hypothetical protein H6Q61_198 [Firmicutes bacterium]|nr:hypothetical protein [Bacillota bacterium]